MTRHSFVVFLTIALAASIVGSTSAQSVPSEMSFQGILTDAGGTGITGTHSVMFSIYPDTLGSPSVWSEMQDVDFENGLFQVYLGEVDPLPDSVFTGLPVWLGIKVGVDPEMSPLTKLVTAPYAFRAGESACVGSVWYYDSDEDGFAGSDSTRVACVKPAGFESNDDDCNDGDPNVNPGATELCDGIDNNCDFSVDEGFNTEWYLDRDEDNWGDPFSTVNGCTQPEGSTSLLWALDCNDFDPGVNPDALDDCDGEDSDCDGPVDEDDPLAGQACDDADDDFCASGTNFCGGVSGIMCLNDDDSPEICGNGVDDDCNGTVDEGCL